MGYNTFFPFWATLSIFLFQVTGPSRLLAKNLLQGAPSEPFKEAPGISRVGLGAFAETLRRRYRLAWEAAEIWSGPMLAVSRSFQCVGSY